jgi:tetratricopeptide (TPR) repeat protein
VTLLVPVFLLAGRWADIGRLYSEVGENRWLVSAGAAPALSPWVYFLTHVKSSVFYYLKRFIIPVGLNADPAVQPVTKAGDPLLIAAVLALLALGAWAIVAARRHRAVTFGLAALLISPLTAYAVMPLADVVAEHRVYVSGLGFATLAAWGFVLKPRYTYAALAAVAMVLGIITFQRNKVWADSLTLWTDTARKSPGLARPHLNLGLAYQSEGQLELALAEYRRALAVNPKLAPVYINMSDIYFARGDVNNCEAALKKAIELSPNLVAPYINLAIMALRQNRPVDALGLLDQAASIDDSHIVRFNRGEALFQLGRYTEAVREYNRAIELKPDLREMKEQIDLRLQRLKETGAIR